MSLSSKEIKAVQWLFPFSSERPVIFDVGSNKGNWTDIFLEEYKDNCDIHLFEPNRIMLDFTRIKYDYNKNITYNQLAVDSKSGMKIPFYYFTNENNGLSSTAYNKEWAETLPMQMGEAETITIDEYCKTKNIKGIDFLKIDTEGTDPFAIAGCQRLLQRGNIGVVQIEYSPHYKIQSHQFKNVINQYSGYGYNFYSFDGDNFIKFDADSFIEDYRFDNFYITKHIIENTQNWNSQFIINTAELERVDLALEIGCFEGLTSQYICNNMLTETGRMVCIDPMKDEYLTEKIDAYAEETNKSLPFFKEQYQRFQRNTKGLPINLIKKTSADAFNEVKDFRFGFIYIDGDHRREAVYKDGMKYLYCTKVGGRILFDDYEWREETKIGIDEFIRDSSGYIEVISKNYQVLIKKINHDEGLLHRVS